VNIIIELPWPAKELSPNARVHWRILADAKKLARYTAKMTTLEVIEGGSPMDKATQVKLHWVFLPPTRREYDDDNLESSCKAYRDGIADALGINDSKFKATKGFGDVIKGGKVVVGICTERKTE